MTATYDCIATTTLGSAQSSVTFSSISANFTDLILVCDLTTSSQTNVFFRFNSDSGSNYSQTQIVGDGSSAISSRQSNQTQFNPGYWGFFSTGRSNLIAHFQNYSNTTTNKTTLVRQNNGERETIASVGLWRSTAAINTISITGQNSINIASGSTFTLYGIKAE